MSGMCHPHIIALYLGKKNKKNTYSKTTLVVHSSILYVNCSYFCHESISDKLHREFIILYRLFNYIDYSICFKKRSHFVK